MGDLESKRSPERLAAPEGCARRFPPVDVTLEQIRFLLSPLYSGGSLCSVERVDGGLTNTILRVPLTDGSGVLLVRIFSSGRAKWEKERAILQRLQRLLPVPELLLADDGRLPHPCLVLRWVDGVTLNAFRRLVSASELLQLAAPLGCLLTQVSSVSFSEDLRLDPDEAAPTSSVESFLLTNAEWLLGGRAPDFARAALARGENDLKTRG
ncbi:MAG: phosphotransferase family protein [Myxococcaceae bacterium]